MKEIKNTDNQDTQDVCALCGGYLDEHSENGYCFECLMMSFTPGNQN
jgi:hypothetical protein